MKPYEQKYGTEPSSQLTVTFSTIEEEARILKIPFQQRLNVYLKENETILKIIREQSSPYKNPV